MSQALLALVVGIDRPKSIERVCEVQVSVRGLELQASMLRGGRGCPSSILGSFWAPGMFKNRLFWDLMSVARAALARNLDAMASHGGWRGGRGLGLNFEVPRESKKGHKYRKSGTRHSTHD